MVEILDCTIRDGSYVIDGQWTKEEVSFLTKELAENGFPYIEVGNGIGLGASRKGVNSICTDEEYVSLAAAVKGKSKIGVFFIPGVGTKEDIDLLVANGGDFIRVGTDVSRSESSKEFIEYALSKGLEVGYNFMKSYVVSPYELCKRAVEVEKYGAQMISLVDSAGGMLPKEVGQYMSLLKECLKVRVGFHGHNNLLIANANNIAAIENGADIIDTTLMGMGRGAGNAQTETMLVILEKMGLKTGIDPIRASNISKKFISPKTDQLKGSDDLQLVMGYAQFHDAFLNIIMDYAGRFDIDYRILIMEVSKINKENPTKELIETVASQIKEGNKVNVFFPRFFHKEVR
jgi:4-hydroxy 2-oxovalerate aldolase